MPKLTVQNAEIKTGTVEVKTLTLSGKQVTISVFKQLYEKPLIAKDGHLNGIAWARVNHHPEPKECPNAEHDHIVWQGGTELFRSTVTREAAFDETFRPVAGPHYLAAKAVDAVRHGESPNVPSGYANVVERLHGLRVIISVESGLSSLGNWFDSVVRGRARVASNPDEKVRDVPSGGQWTWITAAQSLERAERFLAEAIEGLGISDTAKAVAEFEAEVVGEVARRKRHVEHRRAIADLPHLFIAV